MSSGKYIQFFVEESVRSNPTPITTMSFFTRSPARSDTACGTSDILDTSRSMGIVEIKASYS